MSKEGRFVVKLEREVTYVEEVECVVVANNKQEAEEQGTSFCNGDRSVDWPVIDRYVVMDRTPSEYSVLDVIDVRKV